MIKSALFLLARITSVVILHRKRHRTQPSPLFAAIFASQPHENAITVRANTIHARTHTQDLLEATSPGERASLVIGQATRSTAPPGRLQSPANKSSLPVRSKPCCCRANARACNFSPSKTTIRCFHCN